MKKTTPFFWTPMACVVVLLFVGQTDFRNASAAITGKISGIVRSEATQATTGECHSNNCGNKRHHDDK